MKIRSKTNVITNSSDETYIYKTSYDPDLLIEKLKELTKDLSGSGMGGILEAWSPGLGGHLSYPESYQDIPEGYLVLDIDHGFCYDSKIKEFLRESLGEPLGDSEIHELYLPIYQKKYQDISEIFLKTKKPRESYRVWVEWNYYRTVSKSSDKGFLGPLWSTREYLEEQQKKLKKKLEEYKRAKKSQWDLDEVETDLRIAFQSLDKVNKQIGYESI